MSKLARRQDSKFQIDQSRQTLSVAVGQFWHVKLSRASPVWFKQGEETEMAFTGETTRISTGGFLGSKELLGKWVPETANITGRKYGSIEVCTRAHELAKCCATTTCWEWKLPNAMREMPSGLKCNLWNGSPGSEVHVSEKEWSISMCWSLTGVHACTLIYL